MNSIAPAAAAHMNGIGIGRPEFVRNSYAAAGGPCSISYGLKPFYGAKEEVMVDLLFVFLGFMLVGGFFLYDCLSRRV